MSTPTPWLISLLWLISGCGQAPQQTAPDTVIPLISAAESGDLLHLKQYLNSNHEIDIRDNCQWTPLMKAALNGQQDAVRVLLEAGASIDLTDKGGYSAMMLAASNNHAEIVRLLLEQGANVNQVENTNGWTALIWSAKQGHLETVRILLEHKADLEHKDFSGKTAKNWATEGQLHNIVALFDEINR